MVAYAEAMKAVDPDIKIGAVLTMPGNWPDGIVGAGDAGTWNQEVLTRAGPAHRLRRRALVSRRRHGRRGARPDQPARRRDVPAAPADRPVRRRRTPAASRISLTETNVGVGQNTQPGALFLADAYSGLLENGVFTVQWWNVHNGIGTVSTVAGQRDYGDFGCSPAAAAPPTARSASRR